MTSDYIIIAMICAVLSFLIAKEKGRNPIIWAIYGFIFSILGLAAVAYVRKKKK